MYLKHFGLKAQPFQLTPDIGFLFMSEAHTRAKAYMDYSVWNREGFVVITGEIGCGKTTLIEKLLSQLDENVVVAKIFQTQLDEVEFLQAMLVDFGLNPFDAKKVELLDMLNTFLLEEFVQGKQIVLIVDDAHNLSTKVLEEIRMLAGLETRKEKILHVILVGQPQLNEILDHPDMEQLIQRVKLRYDIHTMSEQECSQSILQNMSPSPLKYSHQYVLNEQYMSLATIAEKVGKLEDLPPVLASIRASLAAIETLLRDLVQSRAGDPNSEAPSNRRKSTG